MKMKRRTIVLFFLISISCCTMAQQKGVQFVHGLKWTEVKAKAKAENKYIFVDCFTTWCGPCKMIEPLVEEISAEHAGKLKVVKLDVDHNPEIAMKFHVMSVPTLILFSGGEAKERISGYRPKNNIEKLILPHLS